MLFRSVVIATKSALVSRDIDLLREIRRFSPAAVNITVTAADDILCRKIERNVSVSSERFAALKKLSQAGIPCGVLLMPILPFINDTPENILGIVRKTAEAGAKWIYCGSGFGVTLRTNQREHFYNMADKYFPGVSEKYRPLFGNSYACYSPHSAELYKIFRAECIKFGIIYEMRDICEYIHEDYSNIQLGF